MLFFYNAVVFDCFKGRMFSLQNNICTPFLKICENIIILCLRESRVFIMYLAKQVFFVTNHFRLIFF